MNPFRLASIGDGAPVGAIAAQVTNSNDSGGRLVAFATPVDNASGDFWAIADWNHELAAPLNEPVVIPVAGSLQGNGAFFRTDVAISNRDAGPSTGRFIYYDRTGAVRERDIALGLRESLVLNDVIATSFPDLTNSLGYLEFRPDQGAFSMTSRTSRPVPRCRARTAPPFPPSLAAPPSASANRKSSQGWTSHRCRRSTPRSRERSAPTSAWSRSPVRAQPSRCRSSTPTSSSSSPESV